jgi:hypothetical protein
MKKNWYRPELKLSITVIDESVWIRVGDWHWAEDRRGKRRGIMSFIVLG